jgi:hypothetical protein
MEGLLAEVVASEAWVRSEAVALGERIAPLTELSRAALQLRARLEHAEQLLREAVVAGAAEARTVAEADRLQQRLARHEEELTLARVEVRALKERLRRNAAAHALRQQQQLLALRDSRGAGEAAGKKSALRSAEAGTGALREAAAAMRREAERFQAAREETEQVSDLIKSAANQHRELQASVALSCLFSFTHSL